MFVEEGTLVTDHATGQPILRKVRLRVTSGGDKGLSCDVPMGTVFIGSHQDANLVLSDPQISRRHCEVQLIEGGVRVRDLGSKNGTFYERSKIEQITLSPGAIITMGKTSILVEAVDEPIALGKKEKLGALVAKSKRMAELFALLERAAPTQATVLLEGETGVGKDVLARTLHELSPRKAKPFLVFDCGATAPTLIAAELFGHKKGAFTGAGEDRAGLFEAAKGGTVFLDEIGELPLDLQPSLLRVLESRQVRRVGENAARDIDVRIVAATNRSLKADAEAGTFRKDLFFRLAIIRLVIPPLRDRVEDIPLLVDTFLEQFGKPRGSFGKAELAKLLAHSWPGNARELRNVVEQSCALSQGRLELVGLSDFDDDEGTATAPAGSRASASAASQSAASPGDDALPYKDARGKAIAQFERSYVVTLLKTHAGNISKAARAAGIDRNYIHRLIKKYGIDKSETGAGDVES